MNTAVNNEDEDTEDSLLQEITLTSKIHSYHPALFKTIRMLHGINEDDLISSLDPEHNSDQIFKSNKATSNGLTSNTGGKSGSFFFFS